MKKVLALVAAAGILAVASFASAGSIVQSKHNLSSTGTGGFKGTAANTTQICVYCHAPHQAANAPVLWNRNNPVATTFTLYSGVAMASRQFASGFTTDSTSLFCMSCHDGSTSMANLHNAGANIRANGTNTGAVAGRALLSGSTMDSYTVFGTDLRGTHPINFPVASSDTQGDLWIGSGSRMGGGPVAVNFFPLFATNAGGSSNNNAARTTGRSLECGSCHAVHDSGYSPFLRATMDKSDLCLGCHNK
jgi:predicted CXXCH cytochrome family protein